MADLQSKARELLVKLPIPQGGSSPLAMNPNDRAALIAILTDYIADEGKVREDALEEAATHPRPESER